MSTFYIVFPARQPGVGLAHNRWDAASTFHLWGRDRYDRAPAVEQMTMLGHWYGWGGWQLSSCPGRAQADRVQGVGARWGKAIHAENLVYEV